MNKKNFFSNFSKIKITYNAPVTLTFAIISAIILLADSFLKNTLIPALFTCPGSTSVPAFDSKNVLDYFRIVLHIFGHSNWNHFLSNMAFILLLGPVIEERYGSALLALMMIITSFVTGVLNVCFSPAWLLGSSDIAFMMILLTSFTTISKNKIPLSFILILILYIGRELSVSGDNQSISTLAHIAGGICGSMFAFLATPKPKQKTDNQEQKKEKTPDSKTQSFFNKTKSSGNDDKTEELGSIEL